MEQVWFVDALWLLMALVAVLIANWLKISTALSEIVAGTVAQSAIGALAGGEALGAKAPWITFLAGTGAIVLSFLAGSELRSQRLPSQMERVNSGRPGWLLRGHSLRRLWWRTTHSAGPGVQAGSRALPSSTTSVAVVYAVMLELGFNQTTYGKAILAACFINDLGTVLALGLIFSPSTLKLSYFSRSAGLANDLAFRDALALRTLRGRVSELETKYLLFLLFGLGGIAVWSGSEAVLPAYIIGMVLAGSIGKDHFLIRRLRTLTFGLLTPFYFIRAGIFVSIPVLIAAPLVFVTLLFAKMGSKLVGLLPTVRAFGYRGHDGVYYSLMMSAGLTFGTICALFGLNHGIIDQDQYSHLVATVIGSAVIPTAIANPRFMPRHLLPEQERELKESSYGEPVGDLES